MSISKNMIALAIGVIFLIGSIFYGITMKSSYQKSLKESKVKIDEIKTVASLQRLWKAKGEIKKINNILQSLPSSKKTNVSVKRSKATLGFVNLTDKELNKILTKLAMQPIQFKKLKILRSGEKYSMECLCVW